jgi:hypothetical protein
MTTRNRQLVVFINGEPYYAAQKAQEELGMTYSGLRNQVIAGNIKAEIPKGRRQAYYRGKDVEQLAKEFKVYTIQRQSKPATFLKVITREDMQECQEISQQIFGMGPETLDDRMAIIAKNPDTYFMLKAEDQIVGYAAIIPLKPEKLDKVLAQTIPVQIDIDDIEDFKQNKEIDLYFRVIGVRPGFSQSDKRLYGSRLIAGLIEEVIKLGERGITINTIAARSNMPDGIKLMKGIGFAEIEPLTPERRTFAIHIKESGIPFILQYKRALEEAKQA